MSLTGWSTSPIKKSLIWLMRKFDLKNQLSGYSTEEASIKSIPFSHILEGFLVVL